MGIFYGSKRQNVRGPHDDWSDHQDWSNGCCVWDVKSSKQKQKSDPSGLGDIKKFADEDCSDYMQRGCE